MGVGSRRVMIINSYVCKTEMTVLLDIRTHVLLDFTGKVTRSEAAVGWYKRRQ